ncbi:phage major capsid protein [Acidimicrobiia bacterium]|nr:phage major capsid protein [Acidimicrobiia bacterium]
MSNPIVEKLYEERNNLWDQMKELNDREINEERSLDASEKEAWDKMNDRMSEIDSRTSELATVEEANQKSEEARAIFESSSPAPVIEKEVEAPTDASILRQMANGEVRSHNFEKRDMSVGSDGGLVPQGFYDQIIAKLDENAVVRQFATVVSTAGGEDIKFPQVTALSSASLVAEGGSIGESEPTSASVTLGAFKYAYLTQVSSELLADEGVDIEGFLANDGGRALGNGAGTDFAVGNGSSKPNGLMNASGTGVTCASATVITPDEIIDLYHSVTSPYRINGAWIMNDATLKEVRQLKDTTNQYLWQPGLQQGNPDSLLGSPVATDPNIETIATAKKVMAFGDMSKYFIREVQGIQVDRSVDFAFANDLVTFRFIYRADGDLMDTNAVKRMVMG